tara:strand:- start:2271 stop:3158 length:888 start_codon:yes stop_codon:yes gene_type:complete
MRLIWAGLMTLAFAHSAWADLERPETLDDTLLMMQEKFKADPRVSDTNIDIAQRYISFQINDGPLQISLPDTIHDTLQNASDDEARELALIQFINFTIESSESAAPEATLDLDQIFPVIRPSGFGSEPIEHDPNHEEHGDDDEVESAPVSLPFTADMDIFFVHDGDQAIQFVTAHHLEQLDLNPRALLDITQANLQSRYWDLKIEGGDGLHILSLDGNFETSFMLNRPFWEGVNVGLGSIVAIVAARDLVLFVDGDNEGAINNLRTLVDPTINQFPNPISTTPLIWDNGAWRSID